MSSIAKSLPPCAMFWFTIQIVILVLEPLNQVARNCCQDPTVGVRLNGEPNNTPSILNCKIAGLPGSTEVAHAEKS